MKLKTPQKTFTFEGTELVVPHDAIAVELQNHIDQIPIDGAMQHRPSGIGHLVCEAEDFYDPICIIGTSDNGTITQKRVNFFGIDLVVPLNAKYLSAEDDGTVMAHSDHPWYEPGYYEGYEVGEMAKVDLEGMDWEETLVNIEKEASITIKLDK